MIIAISGLPGTGKTTVARALAERLGGTFFSFGAYVRELAGLRGAALERPALQAIGDSAVTADARVFLEEALATIPPDWTSLIVEGVRHASILKELRMFAARQGAAFRLVHLFASESVRFRRLEARGENAEAARLATSHASERDVLNVLPRDADFCVNTSNTAEPAIDEILAIVN